MRTRRPEDNLLELLAADLAPEEADPRAVEILAAVRATRGDDAELRRRVQEIRRRYPTIDGR